MRIIGSAGYTNIPLGCHAIADVLAERCGAPGHQFWPEDISLLDNRLVEQRK